MRLPRHSEGWLRNRAGDYVIGAVRRIEALINIVPDQDLELLEAVAARGQRVTVSERERRAFDLRQIQR